MYASAHWSFFTSLLRCRGIGGFLRPRNGIPENTVGGGLGASTLEKYSKDIIS
jgi:hypothetical protein